MVIMWTPSSAYADSPFNLIHMFGSLKLQAFYKFETTGNMPTRLLVLDLLTSSVLAGFRLVAI